MPQFAHSLETSHAPIRSKQHGAEINPKDKDGYSASMLPASNNPIESIQLLAASGADLNDQDSRVLIWAIRENHPEAAQALLKLGANPDLRDSEGLRGGQSIWKSHTSFTTLIINKIRFHTSHSNLIDQYQFSAPIICLS